MGVESGREGSGSTAPDPGRELDERTDRVETDRRVHVRRLGVVDTLRWSRAVLRERPALVGLALTETLLSVLTTAGISRTASPESPEIAGWVWAVYLLQLVVVALVSGAVYLTAADEVANRSRPLSRHVVAAAKRLPALAGTALLMGLLVGVSLIPLGVLLVVNWDAIGVLVGLLLTLVSALLGVYVFYRLLPAFPACVVDGHGPATGVREGWLAATGIVRKVFAVGVAYVLTVVASNVVAGVFGDQYDVISTLVSATLGAVVLPFFGLALAHLYLEGSRNR